MKLFRFTCQHLSCTVPHIHTYTYTYTTQYAFQSDLSERAHFPYKTGGVELLSASQVRNVVSIVVDALHATFKVLPSSSQWLPTVWHPPKAQLEKNRGKRGKKKRKKYRLGLPLLKHCKKAT